MKATKAAIAGLKRFTETFGGEAGSKHFEAGANFSEVLLEDHGRLKTANAELTADIDELKASSPTSTPATPARTNSARPTSRKTASRKRIRNSHTSEPPRIRRAVSPRKADRQRDN